MSKRLLVLNIEISGMNKYLFSELKKHGWELIIVDVPLPKWVKYPAMLSTFRLSMSAWRSLYEDRLNKFYKSEWCFVWRIKQCENILKKYRGQYDLVMNMAAVFAPFMKKGSFPDTKYCVVASYAMALSKKYEPWCCDDQNYHKWLDLEKKLFENAVSIITTNKNVGNSLIKDYQVPEEKICYMGYGLTLDKVPDVKKQYDQPVVLFVGFDFKRKGGFALLEAFKKVRRRIPEARLVIIGPLKEVHQIEGEGVEFLGPVNDRKTVEHFFQHSSIFVMPSLCEPFGLVFLEAMAFQMPCIGSNVDAMPEIINDGDDGFLVEPNNIDELADKICLLLLNPEKMRVMGDKAFAKVTSSYAWKHVGDKVNANLTGIIEEQRASEGRDRASVF